MKFDCSKFGSITFIPIFIDEKLFGFISCKTFSAQKKFSEKEILILQIAADILKSAFNNSLKTIELNKKMMQLVQSDRLSTLGTMVAGIAHEINNPNTLLSLNVPVIEKYFSLLFPILEKKKDLQIGKFRLEEIIVDIKNIIQTISIGSDRIQKIVNDLKEFSQAETNLQFLKTNLKDIINKSYTICGANIRKQIPKIEINIDTDLPDIIGDDLKLEQVIINLLVNAAQAANNNKSGFVKLLCKNLSDKIRLCIMDNGCGINKKDISKIFDPFYTTKSKFGGTGLGLSIVYSIIKEHNGKIFVISEEKKGTIFIIDFPINKDNIKDIENSVLILDDRIEFVKNIDMLFIKNGLNTIKLQDYSKIFETITNNLHTDIVIINLLTSNINALELLKIINQEFPWIKIICLTEHSLSERQIKQLNEFNVKKIYYKNPNVTEILNFIIDLREISQ